MKVYTQYNTRNNVQTAICMYKLVIVYKQLYIMSIYVGITYIYDRFKVYYMYSYNHIIRY